MENIRKAIVSENGKSVFAVDIEVSGFHLQGDEPDAPQTPGGKNLAPAPYDYLTAALGECTVMTVRWYAQKQNWQVEKISAVVTYQKQNGKDVFEKTISIVAPSLSSEQISKLIEVAGKCPVQKTLTSEVTINTKLAE